MAQAKRLMRNPILLFGAAVLTALSAFAQNNSLQVARGEEQFNEWCVACHDANLPWSGGGTMALDAKYNGELPGNLLDRTDLSEEFIRSVVRGGLFRMPPFRLIEIDAEELEDLAAFLTRNSSN